MLLQIANLTAVNSNHEALKTKFDDELAVLKSNDTSIYIKIANLESNDDSTNIKIVGLEGDIVSYLF